MSENNFVPRVTLDYMLTEDAMIYTSAAKGIKPPTYITNDFSDPLLARVGSETLIRIGDGLPARRVALPPLRAVSVIAGSILVSEGARIRSIDRTTGIISTVAGTGQPGSSGNGASALLARLRFVTGIAVDGTGNLYLADPDEHQGRKELRRKITITDRAKNERCQQAQVERHRHHVGKPQQQSRQSIQVDQRSRRANHLESGLDFCDGEPHG